MRSIDGAPIDLSLAIHRGDGHHTFISCRVERLRPGPGIAGCRNENDAALGCSRRHALYYAIGRSGKAHIDDGDVLLDEPVDRPGDIERVGAVLAVARPMERLSRHQPHAAQEPGRTRIASAGEKDRDCRTMNGAADRAIRGQDRHLLHLDTGKCRVLGIDRRVDHSDRHPCRAGPRVVRPADQLECLAVAIGAGEFARLIEMVEVEDCVRNETSDLGFGLRNGSVRRQGKTAKLQRHDTDRGMLDKGVALCCDEVETACIRRGDDDFRSRRRRPGYDARTTARSRRTS
jgi:hypothetical protein